MLAMPCWGCDQRALLVRAVVSPGSALQLLRGPDSGLVGCLYVSAGAATVSDACLRLAPPHPMPATPHNTPPPHPIHPHAQGADNAYRHMREAGFHADAATYRALLDSVTHWAKLDSELKLHLLDVAGVSPWTFLPALEVDGVYRAPLKCRHR